MITMSLRALLRKLILAALPIAIAVGIVSAQIVPGEGMDSGLGGANIISGTVYSPGGRVTTRITIRLATEMRGDRVGSTDERGNFIFRGLTSGTYQIIIDKEKDFEPYSQSVEIVQLRGSPPQTYTLSVRLTPKSNAQPKPGVVDAATASLPERGKAYFLKAQDLEKLGDHKGAIEQLKLLTSQYPNFMLGFNELGVEYLRVSEFDNADAAFQAALKIEPDAFSPNLNRGIALVSLKRYADAETVLRKAKKQNDKSGPVRYLLGQSLANLGRFDEAVVELTTAIPMGGKEMAEGHRTLAIIYSSKGDKKKAAEELEAYLQVNPTAPDAEQLKKILEQYKASAQPASAVQKPN